MCPLPAPPDDPLLLQAACTAARLASVLPDPEADAVAAEFLDQLGLSRAQFASWGQAAQWLGERTSPLSPGLTAHR